MNNFTPNPQSVGSGLVIDLSAAKKIQIKRIKVETYLEHCVCTCGGYMIVDQRSPVLTSNPPQIPHVCNKCGARAYYPQPFPRTVLEEVQAPNENTAAE